MTLCPSSSSSTLVFEASFHKGCVTVTFKWNTRLGLSGQATTKSLSPLYTELMFQVLGESTRTMTVWCHGCVGIFIFNLILSKDM